MVSIAEVDIKPEFTDAFARGKKNEIRQIGIDIDSLRRVNVYSIDTGASGSVFDAACKRLFSDSLTQDFNYNKPSESRFKDWDWMVEVGKKPGVKDNVGETSSKALRDMDALGDNEAEVFTSIKYFLSGKLSREDVERAARQSLGYSEVEQWKIIDRATYASDGYTPELPRVDIEEEPGFEYIDLDIADDLLVEISRDRRLALKIDEMKAIQHYFSQPTVAEKRASMGMQAEPTDVELEMLAQTWSEHCKHKIFNAKVNYRERTGFDSEPVDRQIDSMFKTYIKKAVSEIKDAQGENSWIVSTLWDNSGVMDFNDNYHFSFKCETHNSPSAKYPFGGAITGIVGVYRDPMGTGMGVMLIYGTYGFCTAVPFYEDKQAATVSLKPDIEPARLLEGIRFGTQDGGNKSGVPTPWGNTFFHEGFTGKPGVFVAAAGLMDKKVHGKPGYEKMAAAKEKVIMIGGRVGIDGIHGATESSLEGGKHISLGHVQMGDPYTQKKMHDFMIEARNLGLYSCITDNGAGGLSSSVGEMSNDFGRGRPGAAKGVEIYLDRVPLKYEGLNPWQILVSESQERMSLSVPVEKLEAFMELARKHDVEATDIGEFNDSGYFVARYNDDVVAYLEMGFLHDGVPGMELDAEWLPPEMRGLYEPVLSEMNKHGDFLKEMLARPNVCSKEYIIRQFDHEVQATSVVKHLVGEKSDVMSDAVVLRPDLNSDEALAICSSINPDYSEIDTYNMTAIAMDEAIRRIIAVGGSLDQIAMNDNFVWPSPLEHKDNPDAKYKMAQLVRANEALYEYSKAYGTPCISGKDSVSMDSMVEDEFGAEHRVSAPPTIQFSAAGKMNSWEQSMTMDVKRAGDTVYVLGVTRDECGGSEYYKIMGETGLNAPVVYADANVRNYRALEKAMREGLVSSVHGCYKGGLGVALAQSAFAGGFGMEIDLGRVMTDGVDRDDKTLYSESAGRFVLTVSQQHLSEFKTIMSGADIAAIGTTTESKDFVAYSRKLDEDGKKIGVLNEDIYGLKGSWQSTCKHMLYQPNNDKGPQEHDEVKAL